MFGRRYPTVVQERQPRSIEVIITQDGRRKFKKRVFSLNEAYTVAFGRGRSLFGSITWEQAIKEKGYQVYAMVDGQQTPVPGFRYGEYGYRNR